MVTLAISNSFEDIQATLFQKQHEKQPKRENVANKNLFDDVKVTPGLKLSYAQS